MRKLRPRAAVLLIVLAGAGCAPVARLPALDQKAVEAEQRREQISQMRSYYEGVHRVDNVAFLAKTDAQLAVVIGHEMAHANLGHLDKQRLNTVIGFAGGLAIDAGIMAVGLPTGGVFTREFTKGGARAFSVGFEREADYVGAYYAARAGYDLNGAEDLWWAMGQQSDPDSLRFAKTHPLAPVRFLQMRAVAAEIAEKERKHLPLVPELKTMQAAADAPTAAPPPP